MTYFNLTSNAIYTTPKKILKNRTNGRRRERGIVPDWFGVPDRIMSGAGRTNVCVCERSEGVGWSGPVQIDCRLGEWGAVRSPLALLYFFSKKAWRVFIVFSLDIFFDCFQENENVAGSNGTIGYKMWFMGVLDMVLEETCGGFTLPYRLCVKVRQ